MQRILRCYISTEIGQQQQNMRRFYKEATITENKLKKHPLHKYTPSHTATSYFLMAKPSKRPITIPSHSLPIPSPSWL